METTTKNIDIDNLLLNEGQIDGLPRNYRRISGTKFEKLKQSIAECPEMVNLREVIAYPFGDKYVVVAGNMRLRACSALGYSEVPAKILSDDTPIETLARIAILDNLPFGYNDLDLLVTEWSDFNLKDWGVDDLPDFEDFDAGEANTFMPQPSQVFTPTVPQKPSNHQSQHNQISDGDIQKAQDKMSHLFDSKTESKEGELEVVCPKCYNSFTIIP